MQRRVAVLLCLLSCLATKELPAKRKAPSETSDYRASTQMAAGLDRVIAHRYKVFNSVTTVLGFSEDGNTYSYSYRVEIPGQPSYTYTENKVPYAILKGVKRWGDYVALICRDKACIADNHVARFKQEIIRFRNEKAAQQASEYFNATIIRDSKDRQSLQKQ